MKLNNRLSVILLGALIALGLAAPAHAQRAGNVIDSGLPNITVPDSHIGKGFHFDADTPATTTIMPRGGSFGGGGRSFGGGGRSFGGGGFGGGSGRSFGSPRSGGSFGGGGLMFGGTSSPRTSPGSSSFGRTGRMGSGSPTRGTNISAPRGYSSGYYGGRTVYYAPGGYWGGYSYAWHNPMWYYYTPFYPAFYFNPPYMDNYGYYHAGGFSPIHALGGICCCPLIFIGIVWMFTRGFGGKRVKYTTYR